MKRLTVLAYLPVPIVAIVALISCISPSGQSFRMNWAYGGFWGNNFESQDFKVEVLSDGNVSGLIRHRLTQQPIPGGIISGHINGMKISWIRFPLVDWKTQELTGETLMINDVQIKRGEHDIWETVPKRGEVVDSNNQHVRYIEGVYIIFFADHPL